MAQQHEAIFNFNIAESRLWSRTHAQSICFDYMMHADILLPMLPAWTFPSRQNLTAECMLRGRKRQ